MKQLLRLILAWLIFSACGKTDSQKQTPSVKMVTDSVTENINDEEFICMVPISAEFPGGTGAWQQFLKQNLTYPETAIDKNIQGTVTVQFIVCTEGTLCNIGY